MSAGLLLLSSLTRSLLTEASPEAAVFIATAGFLLICVELNRPGSILPGSLGLLLILFAAAILGQMSLQPWSICLLGASVAGLLANLWYELPWIFLLLATLGLCTGLRYLTGIHAEAVPALVAVSCGAVSGVVAATLSRVALRARRAKRVN